MQQSQNPWWKKISIQFFIRGSEFRRDPRMSWKAIVSLFFLGTLSVLGVGYFTYYSAIKTEEIDTTSIVPRSALRPGDVKSVIDIYQKRKERFTTLLSEKPPFLSPGKGAVVQSKEESIDTSAGATSSIEVAP